MSTYKKYYLFSVLGVLLACAYPLYMGGRVVLDMIATGTVVKENYPKYIIPYTPISLAVILGVILMPAAIRYAKRFSLAALSVVSAGVFFLSEFLLENKVVISYISEEVIRPVKLEDWQMYMCVAYPESTLSNSIWSEVKVLLGEYSPAFKVHFYVISLVIILACLNCFHGFAQIIRKKDRSKRKALIVQAVSTAVFLGLCILACFTAFFRTGEIRISAVSAGLMIVFFIMLGITAGVYTGSFLLGKRKWLSVGIPAVIAAGMTALMYAGEMFLLSGRLYRFGNGFFFEGLGGIALAPVDFLVILLAGGICALLLYGLSKEKNNVE